MPTLFLDVASFLRPIRPDLSLPKPSESKWDACFIQETSDIMACASGGGGKCVFLFGLVFDWKSLK